MKALTGNIPVEETLCCVFCFASFTAPARRPRMRLDCPHCKRSFVSPDCAMLREEMRVAAKWGHLDEIRVNFDVGVFHGAGAPHGYATTYVGRFPTFERACEYARRRTRDSLEEHRASSTSPQNLFDHWHYYGEECFVFGGGYRAVLEIDHFIVHPATPEERDWTALDPDVLAVTGGKGGNE